MTFQQQVKFQSISNSELSSHVSLENRLIQWQSQFATHHEVLFHLKNIQRVFDHLHLYQGSYLETVPHLKICWSDGRSYNIEWARTLNGDPGNFNELGFSSYQQFYELSETNRHQFLDKGINLIEQTFLDPRSGYILTLDEFLIKVEEFSNLIQQLATQTLNI